MIQNFLAIYVVDNTLSWKNHAEQITHRLSAACYTMRSVKLFLSQKTMQIGYYDYCHSITNRGLIFWGNSSHSANTLKYNRI